MSREWWANTVAPASFHDAWLASGFASFSTSLYDSAVGPKSDDFTEHWTRNRELLLSANRFGVRPNDAGPIWIGILNNTRKTPAAGYLLAASKGGYILNMLRSMMWDPKTGDDDFRALLQDYVRQFANQPVATADFMAVVEKHMRPFMDLGGNHRMVWFFNEWVYGTDVPSYRLEYSLAPADGGKRLLAGKLTQSGVSEDFRMLVPIFGEFPGAKARLTVAAMRGNSSLEFKLIVPANIKRVLLNLNHDVLTDKEEVKFVK
jgi:aminopeptidase N